MNVNVNGEGAKVSCTKRDGKSHKESVRAQEEGSHQGLHVQQVHAKMKMKWMAEDGGRYRYRRGRSVTVVVAVMAATEGGRN